MFVVFSKLLLPLQGTPASKGVQVGAASNVATPPLLLTPAC
jgi:hypothetical protein